MSRSKFIKIALSTLASTFALAAGAGSAHAAGGSTLGCSVYEVGTDTNSTRLTLHCINDSNHYTTNYAGCAAVNTDQVKMWESMIMAALLSGKKLNIWYNDSCGTRAISGLYVESQ